MRRAQGETLRNAEQAEPEQMQIGRLIDVGRFIPKKGVIAAICPELDLSGGGGPNAHGASAAGQPRLLRKAHFQAFEL